MSTLSKPIESIREEDLVALISNRVSETKTIEYKRDAIETGDTKKKEFLFDVSSFANALGGHIVLGMEEKGGVPTRLVGLDLENVDREKGRLEEIVRDGIRPQIPGFEIGPVPLSNGRTAFVLRIPRSWNPPHQVVFQKAFKIYGRGSTGKFLLDVDQLRSVFSLSAGAAERMRQFRIERIAKIVAGDTSVPLEAGGKVVMHVLPLSAFAALSSVDLMPLTKDTHLYGLLNGGGTAPTYSVDGIWTASGQRPAGKFAQVFRDGSIEAISGWTADSNDRKALGGLAFEREMAVRVSWARKILTLLQVSPPVAVMITLIGMKGWQLATSNSFESSTGFDRDPLLVPEIVLTSLDGYIWGQLKPLLDMAWNAAGHPSSPYYLRTDGSRRQDAL